MRIDKKQSRGRSKVAIVLVVVAVLLVGPAYQQATYLWDQYTYSPPGKLVEVHGRSLHVHCTGAGQPTVVLEAGATGFAQSWAWVQPQLARTNRVCSYDRAGLGWSEGEGAAHTGVEAARNLKALLQQAQEPGPYVMVGHSMGGPLVQIFAGLYPEEVIGVGLIDPSHPDQLDRYGQPAQDAKDQFTKALRLASLLTYTGVVRATNILAVNAQGLPTEVYDVAKFFASSPQHLVASYQELEKWDKTMASARRYMDMADRPLTVISATEAREEFPEPFVEAFHTLHAELAQMSDDARHIKIAGADHFTLLTRQEYAQQTAEALLELVQRAGRDTSAQLRAGNDLQVPEQADGGTGSSPRSL